MKIAVAGGKGGTGKTLVATALALALTQSGNAVAYCDADAEGPNGRLFLHPDVEKVIPYSVVIPALNAPQCSGCGNCQSVCAFHAILAVGSKVMVFPELCHSCGACFIACPDRMLARHNRHIGNISIGRTEKIRFYEGALNIGEARVTPLISGVVTAVSRENVQYTVLDNPPGTSCAAVAAQERADAVVLVTEPTPFGLHDLKLAVALGKKLNKPMLAVLNRSDLCASSAVEAFLESEKVPLVGRIPFSREIASLTAVGQTPLGRVGTFDDEISRVVNALIDLKGGGV